MPKPKKIKLPVIHSLAEFAQLATQNPHVMRWMERSAEIFGWEPKTTWTSFAWLCINARESYSDKFDGERGVVRECNGIRKFVEDELNKQALADWERERDNFRPARTKTERDNPSMLQQEYAEECAAGNHKGI